MVVLTIVNVKLKRVDIVKMEVHTAVNYLRRVSFIPPQYRFIRVPAYLCTNSYDEIFTCDIDRYIDVMKPTLQELVEWKTYPIHINRRN